MAEQVRIRRSQIMAAQVWVEMDIEDGRETPQWIKDLAALGEGDLFDLGDQRVAAGR